MANLITKGFKYIFNKDYRFDINRALGFYNKMPDDEFLKRLFKSRLKYDLDLDNPKTFNEKLQWLKLHDRKPEYTMMVDKYKVREYVANTIGEQYLIPLIAVYDKAEDIDFNKLPQKFVLKCNHNSGVGMCICKDKSKINIRKVRKRLNKGLKQDYYLTGREWPYKNVERKIVCEQFMEDKESPDLKDYKFMCFNGEVKCSFVCSERFSGEGLKVTFFDRDWQVMPFTRHYPKSEKVIEKPKNYELMIELAEKLSKNIPFVRVDFYEVNGKVYFGELTFFPGNGLEEFEPEEYDKMLGDYIDLEKVNG